MPIFINPRPIQTGDSGLTAWRALITYPVMIMAVVVALSAGPERPCRHFESPDLWVAPRRRRLPPGNHRRLCYGIHLVFRELTAGDRNPAVVQH